MMRKPRALFVLGFVLSAIVLSSLVVYALAPHTTGAVLITVNTPVDELNSDGDCSLREAIRAANTDLPVDGCPAGGGADTIILPSSGPRSISYTLSITGLAEDATLSGDLDITATLALSGTGSPGPTIQGQRFWNERIVQIIGPGIVVTLTNITLTNGTEPAAPGGGILVNLDNTLKLERVTVTGNESELRDGGGIFSRGTLLINQSVIEGNNAADDRRGGGIYHDGGELLIRQTTLAANLAGAGAGLALLNGAGQIDQSTLNNNTAELDGGGILNRRTLLIKNSTISGNEANINGGGIVNEGDLTLINATIVENYANFNEENGSGAGLYNNDAAGGKVTLRHTALGDNHDGASNAAQDCAGTLTSQGYNLVESTVGCTITGVVTGNLIGLDPRVADLLDNGGPTDTQAPRQPGSPLLDAGGPTGCADEKGAPLTVDQRGAPRPIDGDDNGAALCDIGAYEAPKVTPTPTATPTPGGSLTPTPTPTAYFSYMPQISRRR